MNEQLSLIKELIKIDNNGEEILKLVHYSYLLNQKFMILSPFFDQTRKVVNDLEKIKRRKISKNSILMKNVLTHTEINDDNYPSIERDIINKYNYYYTALILNDLIRQEKAKSTLRYSITTVLTIISITLVFIASIISK